MRRSKGESIGLVTSLSNVNSLDKAKQKDALILYHSATCGHCKIITPLYRKEWATELHPLPMYEAEASRTTGIMTADSIKYFPTLIYWQSGRRNEFPKSNYPPTVDKIKSWIYSIDHPTMTGGKAARSVKKQEPARLNPVNTHSKWFNFS